MALNSTSTLLPPMMVLAMAKELNVGGTFVIFDQATVADDDLAATYIKDLADTYGIKLLKIMKGRVTIPHNSLIVDPFGLVNTQGAVSSELLRQAHLISSVSCPDNCPSILRFDSNFFTFEYNKNSITEWYQFKGKLFYEQIYSWIQGKSKLETMKEEKWKRRTLKGATLKVATLPWSVIVKQDDKGSKIGFVPELLLGIQVEANFSIEWVEPEDRKYGALVEVNGSTRWNGLVGMAHRHEVDLVAAGLSITRARSDVAAFAQPFAVFASTMILVDPSYTCVIPGDQVNILAFLSVFSKPLWAVFFATILFQVLVGATFYLRKDTILNAAARALSYVFRATVLLSHPVEIGSSPGTISGRIYIVTISLLGLLLMACYEGMLTSFMTHQLPPPSIREFGDAVEQGYQVIVLKDSSTEEALRSSPEGSSRLKVYKETIEGNPKAHYETIVDMLQAMLENPKIATAGSDVSVALDPRFQALTSMTDIIKDPQSFAFPLDSDLIGLFNYHFIKRYNFGIIDFITWKWLNARVPEDECKCPSRTETALALGYENLALPAIILSTGVVAAFIIMAFEYSNTYLAPFRGLITGEGTRMATARPGLPQM